MTRADPSTLGTSGYARFENDHYVTPERTVKSLLKVLEDDLPGYPIWEPFCGDGAFTKLLGDAINVVSTDIKEYDGFTPDAIIDFFKVLPQKKIDAMTTDPDNLPMSMATIEALKGFMPDVIISNPPFDLAEECVRHAIDLMEDVKGDIYYILRNEWDSAKCRADLFRHPAFCEKIVLLHRPRWIAGSTGAPRHNYSYFHWSWSKALRAPTARPEIIYAD
jgi:hypothetical protein